MAETTTNKSFYPSTVDIAGQAVNDFLGLQNSRIAKDQALLEAQTDVAVAQQKAEGDLQKEMLKQQTKAIEAEQKAQEEARKEMQKLRADLPIEDGGMFMSHAEPMLQIGGIISDNLPSMIENLGVDKSAGVVAQVNAIKDRLNKDHTSYLKMGNDLAAKTGTELDGEAGVVEGYDDVSFNESTRIANMQGRFVASMDENYNFFIEDKGYKNAAGEKVQGVGRLPLAEWARVLEEQDLPGLFQSQPKLNYEKTLDEAFNGIVADNKGGVRMPSGFKTDEALDIFLDFNLNDKTASGKNKPLFNTAISQFAIDNSIDFATVMENPDDRTEALNLFRENFKQKAKDFRKSQPSTGSGSGSSKKSPETGRDVMEREGFGQFSANGLTDAVQAFYDAYGVPERASKVEGVVKTGGLKVDAPSNFGVEEGTQVSIEQAAFDADGRLYVSLGGSYAYNPFEDIPAAADSGVEAVEYKSDTKSKVLTARNPQYAEYLQAIGDKLLSDTENQKVRSFYDWSASLPNGVGPDAANFYAGLMVVARQTNPAFEQQVKESFETNVKGVTYDEIKSLFPGL